MDKYIFVGMGSKEGKAKIIKTLKAAKFVSPWTYPDFLELPQQPSRNVWSGPGSMVSGLHNPFRLPSESGKNYETIHCLFNWLIVAVYGDHIWVNIGSSNGLLSDGIKPLPEPILTSQCVLLVVPQSKFAVSGQATCAQVCIRSLQITLLW